MIHGDKSAELAIVSYGNGVPTALQAKNRLAEEHKLNATVIDSPYLSSVPEGLRNALQSFDAVVFADVCKQGGNPLSSFVTQLHSEGYLPKRWQVVSAMDCYNPLACTLTFLSENDIVEAALKT